ncbi:MAG: hypothetical protein K0R92_2623 [Lachnospiraceae bacterium]|jgi:hypothetical protein|nr:hypothetical protein [Lachnospiraceae bacterium]
MALFKNYPLAMLSVSLIITGMDNKTGTGGFMTWESLGTMAGAVTATTLIVQFLKVPLDKVWKIHTRYVAYIIAFIILLLVEIMNGRITPGNIILIALNAIAVSMAAIITYEATFKKVENKE